MYLVLYTVYCKSFNVEKFHGCRIQIQLARKNLWLNDSLIWLIKRHL